MRQQALALYSAAWPHVPPGIGRAATWGGDWFDVSTPFLVRDTDTLQAHVGLITCEFAHRGAALRVAALHGVCVHPDHRGRGLARRALEAALAHVDAAGFETVILWSEKLDLYRRFGFEAVPEHFFAGPLGDIVAAAPHTDAADARILDLDRDEDVELLRRLLADRIPVSEGLAAADSGWHFWIDLGLWTAAADVSLVYLPSVETVVVCELASGVLRLYDVVTASMPPAEVLVTGVLAALETSSTSEPPPSRLEVYFTPDRLGLDLQPLPHTWEDLLMVRGKPLPGTAQPFALSPLTRT